jgi:hypothetical protein
MDTQVLFGSLFCFCQAFKYGVGAKVEVMLEQTLNHSVEFCNFVQCPIFVNYSICFK